MATLAGNFVNASPIGDMTAWFLALDAEIELVRTICGSGWFNSENSKHRAQRFLSRLQTISQIRRRIHHKNPFPKRFHTFQF